MTQDSRTKRAAAETFDKHASAYVKSSVHQSGDDLETLANWCSDADQALDIATGAGHTAGTILDQGVERVVATDAAPEMIRTTEREFLGVRGVVADAERLPFRDDTFGAASCRIAAHHFPDPEAFIGEVSRVLEPGATFAFEDNIVPDDDTLDAFLNKVERLRDPSHVRSHRESEWHTWITEAGFSIEKSFVIKKTIDYRDWVTQLDTPDENQDKLESLFADPPEGSTELYELEYDSDGVTSFANLKVLLRARR